MKGCAMSREFFKIGLVSALCCGFSGCIVPEPRTGNLFLSTRQNFGWLTRSRSNHGLAGGSSIVLGPLFFIGTFTTAPLYDTLCLPYDCYLKFTGSKFMFLDDEMQPVEKCKVSFFSDALPDESPSRSYSSRQGCYSPGIHLNRTSRWSLTATKSGYYPMTVDSDTMTLAPECQVITARLDRIINPVPLCVRELRFPPLKETPWWLKRQDSVVFDKRGFCFAYDFLKSDWLPPWGNGSVADISFRYNKTVIGHELINHSTKVSTNEYCKCELTLEILGENNGLVEITPSVQTGIKVRMAPEDGYGTKTHVCRKGRVSREKFECNYRPDACYAFRIRTDVDECGKIKTANYGKIYGDFVLMGSENEITGLRFLYYFNVSPNDRNLEWDMQHNLYPKPGFIGEPRP